MTAILNNESLTPRGEYGATFELHEADDAVAVRLHGNAPARYAVEFEGNPAATKSVTIETALTGNPTSGDWVTVAAVTDDASAALAAPVSWIRAGIPTGITTADVASVSVLGWRQGYNGWHVESVNGLQAVADTVSIEMDAVGGSVNYPDVASLFVYTDGSPLDLTFTQSTTGAVSTSLFQDVQGGWSMSISAQAAAQPGGSASVEVTAHSPLGVTADTTISITFT